MSVKMRQEVERKIATAVVETLLVAGFGLCVDNGDNGEREFEIKNSKSAKAVLKAMFQTDEEKLYTVKDGRLDGYVYFVYGNDGWDVISDYTVNLEKYVGEGSLAGKISDHYSD
jgi:hypothetical protein